MHFFFFNDTSGCKDLFYFTVKQDFKKKDCEKDCSAV